MAAPPFVAAHEGGREYYARIDGSVAFQVTCPGVPGINPDLWFFRGALAEVLCDERPGIIDTTGRWVIAPNRDGRITIVNDTVLEVRWGPQNRVDLPGQFITTSGRVIGEALSQATRSRYLIDFEDGLIKFGDRTSDQFGYVGYMDPVGTIVIPPRFRAIGAFVDGLAPATGDGPDQWGFIDRTGAWIIPPAWGNAKLFAGALALAARMSADCKSLEAVYINRSGQVVYRMAFHEPSVWVGSRCR